ncbi:Chemoreceptor glutamine deamidase CheD [subsurface metagenome]
MDSKNPHFLYPGTLFASKNSYQIITILGSCVAVCLWDSLQEIGGMNHFLLPLWNGHGLASPKYGNIAIEKLIDKMISIGSKKRNLQAKIFGGSNVLSLSQFFVGKRNIEIAKELLEENSILIVGQSVGGELGRKIYFNTQTGRVYQYYIKKDS